MTLPTDIIDHILSLLQSDPVSLKKCAQSHPILSKVAERYIYANITILGDYDSGIVSDEVCLRVCELSKMLSDTPYIANYVRSLKIRFELDLEKISPMSSHFGSLRKIGLIHTGRLACWPDNMRTVLLDFLRLPSVVGMHLENFVLDYPLLCRCQTLKTLTLSRCLYYPMDLTDTRGTPCPPLLKSLSIDNCDGEFLRDISPWAQTLPLRSVSLLRLGNSTSFSRSSLFPQFLLGCESFLTHLDLDFGDKIQTRYRFSADFMEDPPDVLSKSISLPCLERLTLRAKSQFLEIRDYRRPNYWVLYSPLPEMLQLIKSSPSLKQLLLDFQYGFRGYTHSPLPCADDVWFPLFSLATECLPLSTKICTWMRWDMRGIQIYTRDDILSWMAECSQLVRVVEKGVVIEVVEAREFLAETDPDGWILTSSLYDGPR